MTDRDALGGVAEALKDSPSAVALDVETYGEGLNPFQGEIRLLTLGIPDHAPWVLDLRALGCDLAPLKEALERKEWICHNARFDCVWLRVKCGLRAAKVFCSLTASRLLTLGTDDPNDLGACLERHLHHELPKDLGRSDWSSALLMQPQLEYASNDVRYLHDLRGVLERELESADLGRTMDLEMDLVPVVVDMEVCGVPFDRQQADQILEDSTAERTRILRELKTASGQDFNPDSPGQVKTALQTVGLSVPDTKTETLAANPHPLAEGIARYRAVGFSRAGGPGLRHERRSDTVLGS